jgi:hypothetical protein
LLIISSFLECIGIKYSTVYIRDMYNEVYSETYSSEYSINKKRYGYALYDHVEQIGICTFNNENDTALFYG